MKTVRCAIYTRKSSEEGLEQSFNSLDAQREACAAYILSQASEGWVEVREPYDDGGLSGGTLERPALQRLLTDVRDGRIDIIVVYKVDRLTRSLLDFAKLVEAFDGAGTSFVSVTQSFNTTTSMGRLTLNMLLSFAQFEREVTAERIRDKIAASKARGMWMGGVPPLGYEPNGRSLAIVEEHAELVRLIFRRYLTLGNVRLLAESLAQDNITCPRRLLASGKSVGGGAFMRGQLYLMLRNRIYLGEVVHKEQVFPGLHPAIIDRQLFDEVQRVMKDNTQGVRGPNRALRPSLLAGLLSDEAGLPLVASHATLGARRYRYYVSRKPNPAKAGSGISIPAREIEVAVTERMAKLFDDPVQLAAQAWLQVPAEDYALTAAQAKEIAAKLQQRDRSITRQLVTGVRVERSRILIELATARIAAVLGLQQEDGAPATLTLTSDVRLTRSGRAMRLVHGNGAHQAPNTNQALIGLIARAQRYWRELQKGEQDVVALAAAEGVSRAYHARILRLAFLSPAVIEAILAGKQRGGVDTVILTAPGAIQLDWKEQAQAYLPAKKQA